MALTAGARLLERVLAASRGVGNAYSADCNVLSLLCPRTGSSLGGVGRGTCTLVLRRIVCPYTPPVKQKSWIVTGGWQRGLAKVRAVPGARHCPKIDLLPS